MRAKEGMMMAYMGCPRVRENYSSRSVLHLLHHVRADQATSGLESQHF